MDRTIEELPLVAIPDLERAIILDGEPPSKYRFLDLQKIAWQHHCLLEVAYRVGKDSVDLATAETFINQRLQCLAADGAIDLQGDDSAVKLNFAPNGVPHDTLIYKVDMALPGTAETFYEGPIGSLLWRALARGDLTESAVERFRELTGFRRRDLVELPSDFWQEFADCFLELSLLTLSAFLSQLLLERRKFLKGQPKYVAAHLLPHIYMHLFQHPDDMVLDDWALGLTDEEFAEVESVAERLSAEPSYHRAFGVLQSHAVADMLALHGLHHEVLLTATGKPRVEPSRRKNAEPEKKLSLPRHGFPSAHFFRVRVPSLQEGGTDGSQCPVRYERPSIWLPTGESLGMFCRRQWLATGSLQGLWSE